MLSQNTVSSSQRISIPACCNETEPFIQSRGKCKTLCALRQHDIEHVCSYREGKREENYPTKIYCSCFAMTHKEKHGCTDVHTQWFYSHTAFTHTEDTHMTPPREYMLVQNLMPQWQLKFKWETRKTQNYAQTVMQGGKRKLASTLFLVWIWHWVHFRWVWGGREVTRWADNANQMLTQASAWYPKHQEDKNIYIYQNQSRKNARSKMKGKR